MGPAAHVHNDPRLAEVNRECRALDGAPQVRPPSKPGVPGFGGTHLGGGFRAPTK
jgi:hypothetical protein